MAKNFIEYKILSGDSVSELERQVREYFHEDAGWEVGGNLIVDGSTFYQTVVRVQD